MSPIALQPDTPALQATINPVSLDKTLPMKEEFFLDEKYSSLEIPSVDKDNIILRKVRNEEELAINQPLVTGVPQEFEDEV